MTPANLARHRNNPSLAFWKMLKIGNDHFETTQLEPKVDVCNRLYVFDAQSPPNSPRPLVFNPTDKCPAFVVNPKIARLALEKQRADELEYAQLLEDNVPAAPIYSGLDGGMNKVFLARCVSSARRDLCGGAGRNPRPYREPKPNVHRPQRGPLTVFPGDKFAMLPAGRSERIQVRSLK
jgi:hypothetical protein